MLKMKWTDRLLLCLCAVLGIAAALLTCALIAFRDSFSVSVAGYRISLLDNWITVAVLALIALALLGWSARMLLLAFRRPPKLDKSSVSVQNTENGSVRVSVAAMDMLVKRAVASTEGIVDVKTRIDNHDDSITVNVDMTLESDVHIPNITMLMQRNIKKFIEEYSGIAVREVRVMVSKIVEVTPQPPLRIEAPQEPPEVIDRPDALVPAQDEPSGEPAPPPEPDEAEDMPPVVEYEADHEPPAPEAADGADPDEHGKKSAETITEKDFW